ncbi:MAG: rubredoxin [Clostridia bacterium]|nr:rubredoxin [Clostridia bacterium]
MAVFVCRLCGYEYDEEDGDPSGGISPGTEFYDLPRYWVCPNCGADREDFEELTSEEKTEEADPSLF